MYTDQHTPWEPREILVENIGVELALASSLYAGEFCYIEVEEYLAIREEVNWIIAEAMGLTPGRLSNDPEDDDETDSLDS